MDRTLSGTWIWRRQQNGSSTGPRLFGGLQAGLVRAGDLHLTPLRSLPLELGPGAVVCLAPQQLPLSREVEAVPFGVL